ncbi:MULTISPECIES: non-canonical purine NTP diphosphatase [unclassified Carboxylicivirga]|uniref:non-canonical purine NTP diphosphatase n=1 Tax=Carboxylicivirga TaxID=1628153 RepID=UPI003D3483A4
MELVFATNNQHKLDEIQVLLGQHIKVLSLMDIGCSDEIPETGYTLEANALQKARYIYDRYGMNCFADDTGLEIDALNGAPGVYSARYAGPARDAEANMTKVLQELEGAVNRKARFRTVMALIIDGKFHQFEGCVEGDILSEQTGHAGFGYDPIFQPESYNMSFAEMPLEEKNKISHRGRAVVKLVDFLNRPYE